MMRQFCASFEPFLLLKLVCDAIKIYVLSFLLQVGAITPQNLESLLQSIQGCLNSSDWATRKAAAETLSVLSSNKNVVAEGAASTLNALEACRFDKVHITVVFKIIGMPLRL